MRWRTPPFGREMAAVEGLGSHGGSVARSVEDLRGTFRADALVKKEFVEVDPEQRNNAHMRI